MATEVVKYVETGTELNDLKADLSAVKNEMLKNVLGKKVGERMVKDALGREIAQDITLTEKIVDTFKKKATDRNITRKFTERWFRDEETYNKELKSFSEAFNDLIEAEVNSMNEIIRNFKAERDRLLQIEKENARFSEKGEYNRKTPVTADNLNYTNDQLFNKLLDNFLSGEMEKFGELLDGAVNQDLGQLKLLAEGKTKGAEQLRAESEAKEREAAAKKAAEEAAKKAPEKGVGEKVGTDTSEAIEKRKKQLEDTNKT